MSVGSTWLGLYVTNRDSPPMTNDPCISQSIAGISQYFLAGGDALGIPSALQLALIVWYSKLIYVVGLKWDGA